MQPCVFAAFLHNKMVLVRVQSMVRPLAMDAVDGRKMIVLGVSCIVARTFSGVRPWQLVTSKLRHPLCPPQSAPGVEGHEGRIGAFSETVLKRAKVNGAC
jgi:hypothetical protein